MYAYWRGKKKQQHHIALTIILISQVMTYSLQKEEKKIIFVNQLKVKVKAHSLKKKRQHFRCLILKTIDKS